MILRFKTVRYILLQVTLLFSAMVWSSEYLNYSGRLVKPDGSPVTGSVNLLVELAYTSDTSTILCSKSISSVPLVNGIFHLKLDFSCGSESVNKILIEAPPGESVAIRVTDTSNSKVYSFQSFYSVPYAKVSEISKTLAIEGTSAGQILKWDGSKWIAGDEEGSGTGSVTQINTGTGLSGGPITGSGTISIASGGVTTNEIANATIVDGDISSSAAITRTKIANGTPNYVVVNNPSGAMTEVQALGLAQGGTGATTAAGARLALELGSAALANVGNSAGGVMRSSDVIQCPLDKKLRMGDAPLYPWECVDDVDSADNTKLPLDGSAPMAGNIDMDAHKIVDLAGPTDDGDAANKKYVDDQISNQSYWTKNTNDIYYDGGKVGIGVVSAPEDLLHVGGSVVVNNKVRFKDSTVNYVELKAPANVAATFTLTLPGNNGTSGQVLTTDGAGVLSWSSVATTSTSVGGDLTGTIANAQIAAGAIVDADINASANIAQSKIAGLTTSLAGKEPAITAGTSAQYLRGDKTWQTLNTTVVPEGTNLYFTQPRVLSTPLTGYTDGLGSPIVATDTVLQAFGKIQGQLNAFGAMASEVVMKSGSTMSGNLDMNGNKVVGLGVPTNDTDAATKKYVDDQLGASSHWVKDGSERLSYIDGNVGIGTSSPERLLHLQGPDGIIRLDRNQDIGGAAVILSQFSDSTFQTVWKSFGFSARATGLNSGKFSIIDYGASTSGSGTERMTIGSDGNVGIATSNPQERLHIASGNLRVGADGPSGYTFDTSQGTPDSGFLRFGDGTGWKFHFGRWSETVGGPKNTGTSGVIMTMNSGTGSVGIGTINPSEKLHVTGNIALTGKIRLKDSTTNYVELRSPATVGTTYALTLPTTPGTSGQALVTDGTGILSWASVATSSSSVGGDLTGSISNAQIAAGAIVDADISASANIAQSKIAGLTTDLAAKEAAITAGTSAQYWRGDKTWQTLNTTAVPEGTNLYFTEPRVRSTPLTGYSMGFALPLDASDTVLEALGKLEANLTSVQGTGLWSKSGTNYYYNGGNVGIGTTDPLAKLQVNGGAIRMSNAWQLEWGSAAIKPKILGGDTPNFLSFQTSNAERIRIDALGNVGIGTTSPSIISSLLQLNGAAPTLTLTHSAGANQDNTGIIHFKENDDAGMKLRYSGVEAADGNALYITGRQGGVDTDLVTFNRSGNVGIGTTTPPDKLTVANAAPDTTLIAPNANTIGMYGSGAAYFRGRDVTNDVEFIMGTSSSTTDVFAGSISTHDFSLRTGNQRRIMIKTDGKVGIGTVAPSELLQVAGNIHATAYLYSSDRRLKKNIHTIENPLEKILKLRGVNFDWKDSDNKSIGFIAQEVELIFPEAVKTSKTNGMKSVEYGNLVAPLLEAFKASHKNHEARLKVVESENKKLKNENEELKRRLDRLEELVLKGRDIASGKK